jgi:hypothetical protein
MMLRFELPVSRDSVCVPLENHNDFTVILTSNILELNEAAQCV